MTSTNNIHTVLGAGPVAKATVTALLARGLPVRVVHRSGTFAKQAGLDVVAADIADVAQLTQAFAGSAVVYMCAMPAYHRWGQEFEAMMTNVLQACAVNSSAMVFADNLYMYQESSTRLCGRPPRCSPPPAKALFAPAWPRWCCKRTATAKSKPP